MAVFFTIKKFQFKADFSKPILMKKILFLFILGTQVFGQKNKSLTLLYTNDLHSNFEPMRVNWVDKNRNVGGFANISTLVKIEKTKNPDVLYFDAGDFFTGPYHSFLTKGEAVIDVINSMPIDAVCVGNHEFDHGWQNVPIQFKKANFPILNGNIFLKNSNDLIWNNPYKIFEKNGIKLGVIGLHGKFSFYDTTAEVMVSGIECRDEEEYLKKYIAELDKKVDLIILLVHEGIPGRQSSSGQSDVERSLQKDIELAKNVPGIDVLITGHAHKGTPEALISNGTLIVSTDALGIQLGRLDIVYNRKKDKIVSHRNKLQVVYDDEIKDDELTAEVIRKTSEKLKIIIQEPVCKINSMLSRSYGEESNLGNAVADALMFTNPNADFALTNSGGLREDILGPQVTVGDLITAFPFPNTVVETDLTGKDLMGIFEHGAGLTNGILQVSKGVEMKYDESLESGKRVSSVKINGQSLELEKVYKVLTNNFLADGGDGFLGFKNGKNKKDTLIPVLEAMTRYLKTFETYVPKLEGRVVNIK